MILPTTTRSGVGLQVRGIEGVKKGNAQALEQRRCRRIHAGIRAGHAKALLAQHPCERRHRRPADSNHVNVFRVRHATTAGSRISSMPSPLARTRPDTQRNRQHGSQRVPNRCSEDDRNAQRLQNPRADITHRWAALDRSCTIGKIAQHDSAHSLKLPCLPQMHQRAIDLPWLHAAIFEQQDRIASVQFPRRAERGFHQASGSRRAMRPSASPGCQWFRRRRAIYQPPFVFANRVQQRRFGRSRSRSRLLPPIRPRPWAHKSMSSRDRCQKKIWSEVRSLKPIRHFGSPSSASNRSSSK